MTKRVKLNLDQLQQDCVALKECINESKIIFENIKPNPALPNVRNKLMEIKQSAINLDGKLKKLEETNTELKNTVKKYQNDIKLLDQEIRSYQPKRKGIIESKDDNKSSFDDSVKISNNVPKLKGVQSTPNKSVSYSIPQIGFGLYKQNKTEFEKTILAALSAGYRHFDGASLYDNESDFGDILIKHKISRNEIFVTGKLWNADQGYDNTLKACNKSLKDLKMSYIDLYLVHWPVPKKHCDTWKAMEKLYYDGKCKNIGISNYTSQDYKFLLDHNFNNKNFVKPCVNQLNINPLYWNNLCDNFVKYFKDEQNMVVQSYKIIERGDPKLLKHKIVEEIATKYEITPGQVCIKWGLQNGLNVITKSSKKSRMIENMNSVFLPDFDEIDMDKLNTKITTKEFNDNWYKRYYSRRLNV
mmetsp:Transcript_54666/g.67079  ORF Transcript_54666/g.67079 Transcript_54666/m.67079 type:complete len:414 (-) Transcript_54666:17-1258(-)